MNAGKGKGRGAITTSPKAVMVPYSAGTVTMIPLYGTRTLTLNWYSVVYSIGKGACAVK